MSVKYYRSVELIAYSNMEQHARFPNSGGHVMEATKEVILDELRKFKRILEQANPAVYLMNNWKYKAVTPKGRIVATLDE